MISGPASLRPETILALIPGVMACSSDMAAGVLLGKLTSVRSGPKINPMTGASSISAFHMSSGAVQRPGLRAKPHNHGLMHGVGTDAAGRPPSVIAGEVMLLPLPMFS